MNKDELQRDNDKLTRDIEVLDLEVDNLRSQNDKYYETSKHSEEAKDKWYELCNYLMHEINVYAISPKEYIIKLRGENDNLSCIISKINNGELTKVIVSQAIKIKQLEEGK